MLWDWFDFVVKCRIVAFLDERAHPIDNTTHEVGRNLLTKDRIPTLRRVFKRVVHCKVEQAPFDFTRYFAIGRNTQLIIARIKTVATFTAVVVGTTQSHRSGDSAKLPQPPAHLHRNGLPASRAAFWFAVLRLKLVEPFLQGEPAVGLLFFFNSKLHRRHVQRPLPAMSASELAFEVFNRGFVDPWFFHPL